MTQIISGYGINVNVIATNTYPVGVLLTQFADDADPFDLPSMQIADTAMGINGDMLAWPKATVIKISLSLIPGSPDDVKMGILFEANRVGRGKVGANDRITLTGIYPDGRFITLSEGVITDGMPGNSVASAGRLKSKTYTFAFQNKTGLP